MHNFLKSIYLFYYLNINICLRCKNENLVYIFKTIHLQCMCMRNRDSKQAKSDVPMISYYSHCESIELTIHLPLSTASLKACFMEAMLKAGLNLKKYTPMLLYDC